MGTEGKPGVRRLRARVPTSQSWQGLLGSRVAKLSGWVKPPRGRSQMPLNGSLGAPIPIRTGHPQHSGVWVAGGGLPGPPGQL